MIWDVYALIDPRDRTVFYIGITSMRLAYRLSQHRGNADSAAFPRLRELSDLGFKGEIRAIAEFGNEAEARDYESYLISKTPGLLNRSAPYGKHPDPTPTANPNWPFVGTPELLYEPLEPTDEDALKVRVRKVVALLDGKETPETVLSVLRALEDLVHEDAEFSYATDE